MNRLYGHAILRVQREGRWIVIITFPRSFPSTRDKSFTSLQETTCFLSKTCEAYSVVPAIVAFADSFQEFIEAPDPSPQTEEQEEQRRRRIRKAKMGVSRDVRKEPATAVAAAELLDRWYVQTIPSEAIDLFNPFRV